MKRLENQTDNLTLYHAGLPRFPRNFTRDSVIAALLAEDAAMMRDQLAFCAQHIGRKQDRLTGEEPGKVHHEWPGFPLRERVTTYNACDGSAFFLIGMRWLAEKLDNRDVIEPFSAEIQSAATYIQTHLNDNNLFEDSPAYAGATHFALKVTYWKDSVITNRENGEPVWPAVFTLAHMQNLRAMRAAAWLLDSAELQQTAAHMAVALPQLWDAELGTFIVAQDAQGPIQAVTSDALHTLYYLEHGDISAEQLAAIERSSEALETSIGYQNMTPEDAVRMDRLYHASTIWPFEQALIHAGAGRFGLARVQRVCQRVTRIFNIHKMDAPETVELNIFADPKHACDPQLWTLAAKGYFTS